MIRKDMEELKTQQALTSQAVDTHMRNEEILMKAHNDKLDSIIQMIREDREDNKTFKEKVQNDYITKNEFSNFKKAIGWIISALILFAGAVEWFRDEVQHNPKTNHIESSRYDKPEST